jgi:hypothetical protein
MRFHPAFSYRLPVAWTDSGRSNPMIASDAGGVVVSNPRAKGSTVSGRAVLLGAPLILALLEILHPQPVGVDEHIGQAGRFLAFHVIQLPLIGLVALAVYLLTVGIEGRVASVSRWAAGVFAVFYGAYDTVAGIATGIVLRNARGFSAEAQAAVYEAVKDLPGISLVPLGLDVVGTLSWVVAVVAAAIALRRAGAPRGPFVLLILAGVFLMGGHPFPFGTLAFGCLFIAAAWLEVVRRGTRAPEGSH